MLTPDDVAHKRFTATRLKEGYTMEEVDAFLDEVEETLLDLLNDNKSKDQIAELERELEALRDSNAALKNENTKVKMENGTLDEINQKLKTNIEALTQELSEAQHTDADLPPLIETPEPTPVVSVGQTEIVVRTADDAAPAAARLIELARIASEETLEEARAQGSTLLDEASLEAESVKSAANLEAESTLAAAKEELSTLNSEIDTLRATRAETFEHLEKFFTVSLEDLQSLNVPDDQKRDLSKIEFHAPVEDGSENELLKQALEGNFEID